MPGADEGDQTGDVGAAKLFPLARIVLPFSPAISISIPERPTQPAVAD